MNIRGAVRELIAAACRGKIRVGSAVFQRRYFHRDAVAFDSFRQRHEESLTRWIRFALDRNRDGAAVDVGVNLGQTLLKILLMDRNRRYLGFEPQVACCYFVQRFILDNALENCRLFPFGLSTRDQMVMIKTRRSGTFAGASIVEGIRESSFYDCEAPVIVRTGDDVWRELESPEVALLKVDVEGGELEVLQGLSECLKANQPVVIFEVLHHRNVPAEMFRKEEERCAQLFDFFVSQSYAIYRIEPDSELALISRFEPPERYDESLSNYVALPSSAMIPATMNRAS